MRTTLGFGGNIGNFKERGQISILLGPEHEMPGKNSYLSIMRDA